MECMIRPERIRELARETGFDAAGVAPVALLREEVGWLKRWVAEGKHAGMDYMGRNMELRENPALLVEGARSVVVTLTNYYQDLQPDKGWPSIARYAWGQDYHRVVKDRLYRLLDRLQTEVGELHGRCFTDSAPLLEHAWARRAGLGWQGKNTLLIRKGLGSYCFIGVILSDLEPEAYDEPCRASYCGSCNRCVEACPTGALRPHELDARKCISYHTIENKGVYPEEVKRAAGNRIFGCDICQDVCPWNRHLPLPQDGAFLPKEEVWTLRKQDWIEMDEERFGRLFRNTPLERTGLSRILRNL